MVLLILYTIFIVDFTRNIKININRYLNFTFTNLKNYYGLNIS